MARDHFAIDAGAVAEVFLFPNVAEVGAFGEADLREVDGDFAAVPCAVEEADGDAAATEGFGPDVEVAAFIEAVALLAERVLIDGDRVLVHEDGLVGVGHFAEVVAGEQRRGEDDPEAHVGTVLVGGHLAVADLEHVGVVPVAGAAVL